MADKTEAFDRYQTAPVPIEGTGTDAGDLSGRVFGGFRIVRRLGQGGMGQVYLAEQVSLKRLVALKFLKPQLAENKTALARFTLEAEAVARTSHANIVQIYTVGEENGIHYMALEYVEGKNLREFIEKKGPPDVKLGLRIMSQVAAALQTASELGIVHRDIKPENILINRKGEVKVTDFGLSRHFNKDSNLTESRIAMGTPLYMSPEQVEGRPVDSRTDIYSFGASCYHLFTGRPPFRGESPFEVAVQHVNKEPTPLTETRPDLPIDLCRLIHKMMAKEPEQRYQNGREIQRDIAKLREALTASGGTLAVPVLPELLSTSMPVAGTPRLTRSAIRPIRPIRRRPRRWALVAAMCATLAGGAAAGWYLTPAPTLAVAAPVAKVEKPDVPVVVQELFDPKQRAKVLAQKVRDVLDMSLPKDRLMGIDSVIAYGALLLRERRLDEAETLFQKAGKETKANAYRWVVELGHAMVLAQRDKFAESNRLFKSALDGIEKIERTFAGEPKGKNRAALLRHWEKNLDWREQMASALQRNYDNSPKDFPADARLDTFRRPPGVVTVGAKGAGAGP
ncbi:MAG TPA: serine/threonine-protein kinase [Gemmataceae bacterium]|nr:serine/threonine-protein kinase [Gemmataceae bacterium]